MSKGEMGLLQLLQQGKRIRVDGGLVADIRMNDAGER